MSKLYVLLLVAAAIMVYSIIDSEHSSEKTFIEEVNVFGVETVKIPVEESEKKSKLTESERLKKLASVNIDSDWSAEYGCFDEHLDSSCGHVYLTAESLEEAEWMRRNGYPNKSLLDGIDVDSASFKQLLDQNNTDALKAAAIHALSENNHEVAEKYALRLRAYSSKRQAFSYTLYADALRAGMDADPNNHIMAAVNYQIAGLIGDSEAALSAASLCQDDGSLMQVVMSQAYTVFGRQQNIPLGELPIDPRPGG